MHRIGYNSNCGRTKVLPQLLLHCFSADNHLLHIQLRCQQRDACIISHFQLILPRQSYDPGRNGGSHVHRVHKADACFPFTICVVIQVLSFGLIVVYIAETTNISLKNC